MAERGDEGDDDDDEEPRETISRREIEAQVRKAAREKVAFPVSGRHEDGWLLTQSVSRNTTRPIRLILWIPVLWTEIRMTMSLPCAPAKLQRGPPKSGGLVTPSMLWYDSALTSAIPIPWTDLSKLPVYPILPRRQPAVPGTVVDEEPRSFYHLRSVSRSFGWRGYRCWCTCEG